MSTTLTLQQQLDKLDAAIASGTVTVEIPDYRKTFASATDLLAERAHIANLIAQESVQATGRGSTLYSVSSFPLE